MAYVFLRSVQAPLTVRGFVRKDVDGNYNVFINDKLDNESAKKTLQHELQHIKRGHLSELLLKDVAIMELETNKISTAAEESDISEIGTNDIIIC